MNWATTGVPLVSMDAWNDDQELIGPSKRLAHRAYLIRAIDGLPGPQKTTIGLAHIVLDLGEYTKYLSPHATLLPTLTDREELDPVHIEFPRPINVSSARIEVWNCSNVQSIAVFIVDFSGDLADLIAVSRWLTSGRFVAKNARMRLVTDALSIAAKEVTESKLLEKHILVVPTVGHGINYDLDAIQRIVHRANVPARNGANGLYFPDQMNRRPYSLCAHGSHATVLLGHQEYVENACLLGLCQIVAAAERMNAILDVLISTLEASSVLDEGASLAELQHRLTDRYSQIRQLHAEIGLGVEVQIGGRLVTTGVRIREYCDSVVSANNLRSRLDTALRVLDRLEQIVRVEGEFIESVQRTVDKERRSSWTGPLLALPAIAVPLTLVLAYLGANVEEVGQGSSLFDVSRFGWVYAGVLMVTLLVLMSGLPALLRARRLATRPHAHAAHLPSVSSTNQVD